MKVNPETLTVGELATLSGTTARSIRYYDEHELLPSDRGVNGYREFPATAVETVIKIRALLDAGYNLRLITQLLPCTKAPAHITLCPMIATEMRDVLDRKQAEASRLLGQVNQIAQHLHT